MLTIRFDCSATEEYLDRLKAKLSNPEPLLKGIGEDLMHSTKERFKTSTAPDGSAWAPNLPAAICAAFGVAEPAGVLPVNIPALAEGNPLVIDETMR